MRSGHWLWLALIALLLAAQPARAEAPPTARPEAVSCPPDLSPSDIYTPGFGSGMGMLFKEMWCYIRRNIFEEPDALPPSDSDSPLVERFRKYVRDRWLEAPMERLGDWQGGSPTDPQAPLLRPAAVQGPTDMARLRELNARSAAPPPAPPPAQAQRMAPPPQPADPELVRREFERDMALYFDDDEEDDDQVPLAPRRDLEGVQPFIPLLPGGTSTGPSYTPRSIPRQVPSAQPSPSPPMYFKVAPSGRSTR